MSTPSDVLVVGAGAAGLAVVESLRRKGYGGRITLLGDETGAPYDRPPLSKQVLAGSWDAERTHLRSQEALDALEAEFVLGERAVALDAARRTVSTASGTERGAEAVVLATGLHARRLPGLSGPVGIHVLRTLDDATRLRGELLEAERVVVVGDGVLGAEIAATARQMGCEVTLGGPQTAPMRTQLGRDVAELLAALHAEHGVRLRPNTLVEGVETADGRVTGVRSGDGEVIPADLVVSAVGGVPATGWLAGSGLALEDGVVCDSRCRAAEGVYAVGDAARFHHEALGRSLRLENRTNATEQAMAAAANILGEDRPYSPVPYFWTDQLGVKIQVYGLPSPTATVQIVEGSTEQGRFVARYLDEGGGPVAVLGWNMPKQARQHRQHLVDRYSPAARPQPAPAR
ncbi:NAD(P)/FAD-dependent oxidoreductase [Streptomyces sp. MW-W600-10]|uniref:NAD(P)/FAD-dependent oxidoreductase n=1 Tax=Streptomyces sp. MW-W600-10 TaxID=2829819 RepID=UPI001C461E7F|nr:FAD/NAD(P)-binding oxidoreductase [Streptomyces sp. MW-W600-10]MBV7244637.1 NAD(P)/FAD-dependent oxidoreductase [Streptomyces sp. MW-W600-10]